MDTGDAYIVEISCLNTKQSFRAPVRVEEAGVSFELPANSLVKGQHSQVRLIQLVGDAEVASNEVSIWTN